MKPKTTVFLVFLLLLCVGYVAVRKSGWFDKPEVIAKKEEKVFPKAPSGAKRLTIEPTAGKSMVFEKDGEGWRIAAPIRAKADKFSVSQIVDALLDLKYTRQVQSGEADAGNDITGLDKPRWVVTLTDKEDKAFALQVGRDQSRIGAGKTSCYVRSGDKTYVVAVDFTEKLRKPLKDFRNKTVLELNKDRIVSLAAAGSANYRLVKDKEQWGFVQPMSAPAKEDKVKDLLGKLTYLTTEEFVDDDPANLGMYGLAEPQLLVSVEVKPEEPKKPDKPAAKSQPTTTSAPTPKPTPSIKYALAFGRSTDKDKKVFARLIDAPSVFKLDASLLKDLQPKLIDLRNKKVLAVSNSDVVRIVTDTPAGKAELVKANGQWRMKTPLAGNAGDDVVGEFLSNIDSLEAVDFVDSEDALRTRGLEPPIGKITLHLTAAGKTSTLLIGAKSPSGDMRFVKTSDRSAVAVVTSKSVKALLREAANFWDPQLLALAEGEKVSQHALRRGSGKDAVEFKLVAAKDQKWRLTAPLQAAADKENVDKILDKLEKLKATKIVAVGAKLPARYAKAKRLISVRMQTETPAPPAPETAPAGGPASTPASKPAAQPSKPIVKEYRLKVARLDLHSYAWIEDAKAKVVAIGQFSTSLYDDLAAELRDRVVWKIEPDDVRNFRLGPPASPLELRRDDKEWVYTRDRHVTIDAEKVSTFLKDIQEFKAEKFVTHGPSDPTKFGLDKPWLIFEMTVGAGNTHTLTVASEGKDKAANRYATATGVQGVFLVTSDNAAKLSKLLADFKK